MAAEGRDGCLEPGQSTGRPGVEWAGRQVQQDELSEAGWWSLAMASSCAWWRAGRTWRQTGRDETGLNEDKRLARRGGGATQDCFTGEREERLCQAVSCRYIAAWRTAFKEYDGQSKGNKAS